MGSLQLFALRCPLCYIKHTDTTGCWPDSLMRWLCLFQTWSIGMLIRGAYVEQDVDFNSPEIVRVILRGLDEASVWRPGAAISHSAALLPVTEIFWRDRLLHPFLAHSRRGYNVSPTSYKPVPAVVNDVAIECGLEIFLQNYPKRKVDLASLLRQSSLVRFKLVTTVKITIQLINWDFLDSLLTMTLSRCKVVCKDEPLKLRANL